ncbi:hypothetical protein CHS0354_024305 [Potamilus streckersoni]|uniref:Peptidase M12B domain-containing protein n=1 Tax=Potamilus streckersoni TaxID=2493646 RepID=A0AAE0RNM4_9BIVA|nr:hypothetical protein CHS0354_024305 [Potamilus streckersoni]
MKYTLLPLIVYVSVSARSNHTDSDIVWLKDVTTNFQTDKRKFDNLDFAEVLTFHLSHVLKRLTLNLKKNHEIDPNAKIYVVRKLNDDRFYLEKTPDLGKEEVAYYQDVENGAFVTIRCVKRSSGECDRVVNGNVRIEGRNYDLRPAETGTTLRDLLDVPDLRGTRYVLRDQTNIQREMSVKMKDVPTANERKTEQDLKDLLRTLQHRQNSQIHLPFQNSKLSSRNVASLDNRGENSYGGTYNKDGMKVNMRYKTIEDPSIEIIITLREFFIFRTENDFPHVLSAVQTIDGSDYVDIYKYLFDLTKWTQLYGSNSDHVMLFTRHNMFDSSSLFSFGIKGLTHLGKVCDESLKSSVVQVRDYFMTMGTASHELGHSLGADHDGEGRATACRAEDLFIMTTKDLLFDKCVPYSRNPWIFSNCSVDAFKDVPKNKTTQPPGESKDAAHHCSLRDHRSSDTINNTSTWRVRNKAP